MHPEPVLRDDQKRILWLLSEGNTYPQIAERTGSPVTRVQATLSRIIMLLGARNGPHAVRIGLLDGHIGPWEDCGTLAAWRRHIHRDEQTCPACKRGNAERVALQAAMKRRPRMSTIAVRLLRALDAGQTNKQIRASLDLSENALNLLLADVFDQLGVANYSPRIRRQAALKQARALGLLHIQLPGQKPDASVSVVPELSDVYIDVLLELERGASINETAQRLGISRSTCTSRITYIYNRLGVAWLDKDTRRQEAIRRARAAGLMPEPAPV
jgi:DNA-binding NarL/FixJ family response regulator